jgi:hypothetical protein
MNRLVPLTEVALGDGDEVGAKAAVLGHLVAAGVPVPAGVVVPSSVLWEAVCAAGGADRLARLAREGVNHGGMIRALLWRTDLSTLERELRDVQAWGQRFAVRSSSTLEDRTTGSSAGMMTSLLGIGPEGLLDAVRAVWASGFSPLMLARHGAVPPRHPSVIVQKQVDASIAGVCFSTLDPSRPSRIVAECVTGTAHDLLDGALPGRRYEFDRSLPLPESQDPAGLLSAQQLTALRRRVVEVEEILGHPIDMEFAFEAGSGVLYTLQARPIVTPAMPQAIARDTGTHTIDPDDIDRALRVADGALASIIARRADKHRFVRRLAWKTGIRTTGEWLIPAGDAHARPDAARLADDIRRLAATEPIALGLPHEPVSLVARVDAEEWLGSRLRPGDTVYAAEVHVGRTSGHAALRKDGSLVVEYIAGAVGGLKHGDGPFSRLIQDARTGDRRETRVPTTRPWELDLPSLRFVERPAPAVPDPLDDGTLAELRRITEALTAELGEVRVEWLRTPDGRLLLWDLSLEGAQLPSDRRESLVSAGSARGEALVLPDVTSLHQVMAERNVLPDPEFFGLHASAAADAVRRELLAGRHQPIVVTPRPRACLALLLGHVSGFVFDQAPLLCHLSIILREEGVPAVADRTATKAIRDGALLELREGDWRFASPAIPPAEALDHGEVSR